MLVDEANGKLLPFSILTVHAQDHFMTSMLANDLIKEMIQMEKNHWIERNKFSHEKI